MMTFSSLSDTTMSYICELGAERAADSKRTVFDRIWLMAFVLFVALPLYVLQVKVIEAFLWYMILALESIQCIINFDTTPAADAEQDSSNTTDSPTDDADTDPDGPALNENIEELPGTDEQEEEATKGDTETIQAPEDKEPAANTETEVAIEPDAVAHQEAAIEPEAVAHQEDAIEPEAVAHQEAAIEPEAVAHQEAAIKLKPEPEPTKKRFKEEMYISDASWDTSL